MSTNQLAPRPQEEDCREAGLLEAVILDGVVDALGRPKDPHQFQVKRVWGDRYRVNVFIGQPMSSFRVAHSYFVQADRDGKILASSPAITRLYAPAID